MRCQECKRYFTPNPKPMGYDSATKEMALRLYLEGTSFRAVGRLLSVNYVSVINWVNAHEKTLPARVEDQTPTDTVEVDELFTFIEEKKSVST
jgi:transposase-like protein